MTSEQLQLFDLDEYKIEKMISGWLYRNVYLSSKGVKKYVIKESKNEYIFSLIRESTIMNICNHLNIIKFY